MFKAFGLPELLVVLAIVVLMFGVGRVSKIGRELGSAIGAIRQGMKEEEGEEKTA
jgi:sec-independent protein translocase protein TatA